MKNQMKMAGNTVCLFLLITVFTSCFSASDPNETKPLPDKAAEISRSGIHTVEIKQMQFVPAILKVKKGDRVMFVNKDFMAHDVTEQGQKNWSSSALQSDGSWTMIAMESADYYCSIHPVMKGKIVVE